MIEKYKKELVDAKSRSITDAIEEISLASDDSKEACKNEKLSKTKENESQQIHTQEEIINISDENEDVKEKINEKDETKETKKCQLVGSFKIKIDDTTESTALSSFLVTVYKSSTDEIVFRGYTDENGNIEPIKLSF